MMGNAICGQAVLKRSSFCVPGVQCYSEAADLLACKVTDNQKIICQQLKHD